MIFDLNFEHIQEVADELVEAHRQHKICKGVGVAQFESVGALRRAERVALDKRIGQTQDGLFVMGQNRLISANSASRELSVTEPNHAPDLLMLMYFIRRSEENT